MSKSIGLDITDFGNAIFVHSLSFTARYLYTCITLLRFFLADAVLSIYCESEPGLL